MANADKSITEFPNGTLKEDSLFVAADVNAGTGHASVKHSASAVGAGMCGEGFTYNDLETGNKSIFAAINELNSIGAYKTVTGTLTAGETSITLQDADITEDSLLTFYTNILGVNPISETHTNGSVTLTFEAQATDMVVGVNIMGAHGGGGATSIESEFQRVNTTGVSTIPKTCYTFTAENACLLSLLGTCATDTSRNEGYIYCNLNGTMQGSKVYLITGQETAFDWDLSLSAGDVVEIVASWDGSHSNCYFDMRLSKAVAS